MSGFGRFKFALIVLSVAFNACSKTQTQDPVGASGDLAGIDPDQKAIAKDMPASNSNNYSLPGESEAKTVSSSEAAPANMPATETTVDGARRNEISEGPGEVTSSAAIGAPIGKGPKTRFIKAATLNIRSQPNRRSKIVGSLKGGDKVHVKIYDGWAKLDEGQWIRSRWLVKTPPSSFSQATEDQPAQSAKRFKTKSTKKRIRRK